MNLTVSDSGHRYNLLVRTDVDVPAPAAEEAPQHQQFIEWWRAECRRRNIPYTFRVAEPQGHRIVLALLRKHTLRELKGLAKSFFLDYSEQIIEDPHHFVIFSSLVTRLKAELKQEL